jgi:uncharacterized protein YutE (UPF0331/DUF86 family)
MNLKEQIQQYKEISTKIQELEEQKKLLCLSIMQVMTEKSLKIGNYLVRRFSRLSITTSLDIARSFNAIKIEETVDKETIKTLYTKGVPISGVKEVNYIQISVINT